MLKTIEGKWVVFEKATGQQAEHWPVDAKLLFANGTHTAEPPKGVKPVLPVAPPPYVGVPKPPVATVFEAPAEQEPAPGAKRGRKE